MKHREQLQTAVERVTLTAYLQMITPIGAALGAGIIAIVLLDQKLIAAAGGIILILISFAVGYTLYLRTITTAALYKTLINIDQNLEELNKKSGQGNPKPDQ